MTTEALKAIEQIDKKYQFLTKVAFEICEKNGISPMDVHSFAKMREIEEYREVMNAKQILRTEKEAIKNSFKNIEKAFDFCK